MCPEYLRHGYVFRIEHNINGNSARSAVAVKTLRAIGKHFPKRDKQNKAHTQTHTHTDHLRNNGRPFCMNSCWPDMRRTASGGQIPSIKCSKATVLQEMAKQRNVYYLNEHH